MFNAWINRSKLFLANTFRRKQKAIEGLEFAFNCGGKAWYKWQNTEDMPILRLMTAKDYLDLIDIGAERSDLISYLQTVAKALSEAVIDRAKLAVITQQLEDRLNMVTNTELLYKLACCYYVSEDEILHKITPEEVELKTDFFKENAPIEDFFLTTRLRDLLPSGSISELNLRAFSRAERIERKERLTSLVLLLNSLTDKDTGLIQSLRQQTAAL